MPGEVAQLISLYVEVRPEYTFSEFLADALGVFVSPERKPVQAVVEMLEDAACDSWGEPLEMSSEQSRRTSIVVDAYFGWLAPRVESEVHSLLDADLPHAGGEGLIQTIARQMQSFNCFKNALHPSEGVRLREFGPWVRWIEDQVHLMRGCLDAYQASASRRAWDAPPSKTQEKRDPSPFGLAARHFLRRENVSELPMRKCR